MTGFIPDVGGPFAGSLKSSGVGPGPDGTQQPGGSHEDGGTGRTWAAVDAMAAPTGVLALRQDCPYVAFPMEDGGASGIRGC